MTTAGNYCDSNDLAQASVRLQVRRGSRVRGELISSVYEMFRSQIFTIVRGRHGEVPR